MTLSFLSGPPASTSSCHHLQAEHSVQLPFPCPALQWLSVHSESRQSPTEGPLLPLRSSPPLPLTHLAPATQVAPVISSLPLPQGPCTGCCLYLECPFPRDAHDSPLQACLSVRPFLLKRTALPQMTLLPFSALLFSKPLLPSLVFTLFT